MRRHLRHQTGRSNNGRRETDREKRGLGVESCLEIVRDSFSPANDPQRTYSLMDVGIQYIPNYCWSLRSHRAAAEYRSAVHESAWPSRALYCPEPDSLSQFD